MSAGDAQVFRGATDAMKIAILQSNYLPWRGYFDLIAAADLFVVYDDVQFTKNDWRNRNRIKTQHGLQWLTVPVRHRGLGQTIAETGIEYVRDWRRRHRKTIAESYARAPHVGDALAILDAAFAERPATISELNLRTLTGFCRYLGIGTPFRASSEFRVGGDRNTRLIGLLQQLGATTYVSGPRGRGYLDEVLFRAAGIALEYKSYCYRPYPQLWGAYQPAVSIVDVVAHCGPSARALIASEAPNEVAVA
jgi:hypothetical protein